MRLEVWDNLTYKSSGSEQGSINNKSWQDAFITRAPLWEGEVRLRSVLLMHINPHLHLNASPSAGGNFLTGPFSADSGSKRMFFYEETSRGDLVGALFRRGGPPPLQNSPTQQEKK